MRRFRVTYELNGEVSAYIIYARSKYNAKLSFYLLFPMAKTLKVEEESDEQEIY